MIVRQGRGPAPIILLRTLIEIVNVSYPLGFYINKNKK